MPDGSVVSLATYNQMFTMHGTTMVFLVVMPGAAAFFNYLIPLQIEARDVAFPRLNSFSYWSFLAGGLILNFGWLIGSAPAMSWVGCAPITTAGYTDVGTDLWIVGLTFLAVASTAASVNFIVTILGFPGTGHDDDAHAGLYLDDLSRSVPAPLELPAGGHRRDPDLV